MSKRENVLNETRWTEGRNRYLIRVYGGLSYIKGNSRPYFSVTGTIWENGRDSVGGCIHDEIEKHFPGKYSDLIRLHLSDDMGQPMHSAANGLYWLAGLDESGNGFGERYHGGNREFANGLYWLAGREECLRIVLNHFRCAESEIQPVLEALAGLWLDDMRGKRLALVEAFCETLRPRWLAEARAAIANHSLISYGDEWHGTPGGLAGKAA